MKYCICRARKDSHSHRQPWSAVISISVKSEFKPFDYCSSYPVAAKKQNIILGIIKQETRPKEKIIYYVTLQCKTSAQFQQDSILSKGIEKTTMS